MPITDLTHIISADRIDPTIASDAEYLEGDAAVQTWAESRFEYRKPIYSKVLNGPLSFSTSAWTSLGTLPGLSLGTQGELSILLVGLCFLFDLRYLWQQATCSGQLSPVWWQPAVTSDTGIRVPLEIHNESGFYVNIRASQPFPGSLSGQNAGQNRYLEIKPENSIQVPSGGQLKIAVVKFS